MAVRRRKVRRARGQHGRAAAAGARGQPQLARARLEQRQFSARARARVGATYSRPHQSRTGVGLSSRARERGCSCRRLLAAPAAPRRSSASPFMAMRRRRDELAERQPHASEPMKFDELASAPEMEHAATRLLRAAEWICDATASVNLIARERGFSLRSGRVDVPAGLGTDPAQRATFFIGFSSKGASCGK